MTNIHTAIRSMPDVAAHALPRLGSLLDWVGMDDVQMPIRFDGGDGKIRHASARVGVFVNLVRPDRRGIHMSRLYLLVDQYLSTNTVDTSGLKSLLSNVLESHTGLSDRARIRIRFDLLVRRTAMRSGHTGWRTYPIVIEASLCADGFRLELGVEVMYSSTCPASAALSRQLVQEQFIEDFDPAKPVVHATVLAWLGSEQGIIATPHAQRSIARLSVHLADGVTLNPIALLDRVEQCLGTPVQAAVKREDEQAFALANGGNLMFCEDAARRIQHALDADGSITDFHIRLEHQESLHPHDAVAYASKSTIEAGAR